MHQTYIYHKSSANVPRVIEFLYSIATLIFLKEIDSFYLSISFRARYVNNIYVDNIMASILL